jgi:hypothetical protein
MNPFQKEDNSFIFPVFGDIYLPLIPCNTDIMLLWLKPFKDLYVTRLAILLINGIVSPFPEQLAKPPVHIRCNIIAISLLLQRSWKMDRIGQFLRKPLFRNTFFLRIDTKLPFA